MHRMLRCPVQKSEGLKIAFIIWNYHIENYHIENYPIENYHIENLKYLFFIFCLAKKAYFTSLFNNVIL